VLVWIPEAIICAVKSSSFEDAIRNAISIGGDSDTIAAISGSIAEAIYGVPEGIKEQTMSKLPQDMINIIQQFNQNIVKHRRQQKKHLIG